MFFFEKKKRKKKEKEKEKENQTWTNWETLHLSLSGRMLRHDGVVGVVGAVVLGGEFMGAALAEWETEWGRISEGRSGWRGGMEIWSSEISGCCMWPLSIPSHKLLPIRTLGWDSGLRSLRSERERGCPVGPVRSAAATRGRRWFHLTRACRSEYAEKTKTKVEEMRERREAVCVWEENVANTVRVNSSSVKMGHVQLKCLIL